MLISGKVIETEILTELPSSKVVIAKNGMEMFAKNIILTFLANRILNKHSFDHLLHVSFCERLYVCLNNITESNYSLN